MPLLVLVCFNRMEGSYRRWHALAHRYTHIYTRTHAYSQKDSGLSGAASLAQRRHGGPDTCRTLAHNLEVTPRLCAGMLSAVQQEQRTLGRGGKSVRGQDGRVLYGGVLLGSNDCFPLTLEKRRGCVSKSYCSDHSLRPREDLPMWFLLKQGLARIHYLAS